MRASTKRSNKVQQLLYGTFRGNTATRYGAENEETTRQRYVTHMKQNGHPNLIVQPCGLFISLETPWLAATPDGLVHDPASSPPSGLIEVKNPYSARHQTIEDAVKTTSFCLELNKDRYRLKRRHDYYFQIQCQLYCTDRQWCDFILTTCTLNG